MQRDVRRVLQVRRDRLVRVDYVDLHLLLNEAFYGHEYFDDVFVISNTIKNDQTSRFVREHFDVEDHYNDSMIDSLVDRQMGYKKKDQPDERLGRRKVKGKRSKGQFSGTRLPPSRSSVSMGGRRATMKHL